MLIAEHNYTQYNEGACSFESYPTWVQDRIYSNNFDNIEQKLTRLLEERIAKQSEEPISALPLGIVATLIQRNDLLERLHTCGLLRTNQTDDKGYTAAHFAAIIGSRTSLSFLRQIGADYDQKTNLGATVHDFLRYRGIEPAAPDESIFSASALLCLWHEKTPPAASLLFKECEPQVQKPPIYMQLITCPQSPLFGQREVVASRDIQAGEFIVEYTGHVEAVPYRRPSDYIMVLTEQTVIDANHQGSLARFINHGPSNCSCQTFIYKGVPRIGLFALRNLAKGEQVLFNYGANYFLNAPFYELNAPFLDHWISEQSLTAQAVNAAFGDTSTEKSEYLRAEEQREVYFYLYEFPDHLIDCIKQQKLTREQVREFFDAVNNNAALWGRTISKYLHEEKLKRILF